MSDASTDRAFSGSIPQLYERYLVPLIFEPYAADISARVAGRRPARVLEIAAGTGVVTRHLANDLPPETAIIATDLNQSMLDQAASIGTARAVEWRTADATQLPFDDDLFDVVVIQFGVMFVPDKPQAFAEARRVLRRGGMLLFNVWDHIEHNEFADTVTRALQTPFPHDPPRFMARVPHGYHDTSVIAQHLTAGGFHDTPMFDTITARSKADSARIPAIAYCQGTPLRNEIELRARDPVRGEEATDARVASRLEEATTIAAKEIERRFGSGPVSAKIQAHVIAVER